MEVVRERAPITVGEMAKAFGEPRGLARTTVLTMMERLRSKGFLQRSKEGGVFHYSPKRDSEEAMKGLVADFVRRSLGGSLSPFVSYLVDSGELSSTEQEQLRRLVDTVEKGGA
ncbi:putative transcriptional regulator [Fimbriimonas ginsengisoli Gsoil 348]|uniref:Putative transcriptional regulator n=1 Tax=Fimbriimonas ginsengisoli Gsoil 348 TaxID=661478 RepID=A0A068NT73_FIMGI|nr:putative transcriptional regulator [Fimbriimonas ginsengisoli Gsoil 348]